MSATHAAPTTARSAATRAKILEAAAELFYAHGLRAVSADRIIERAGITKVTFYRHFPTKDDLLVAYLERRAAWERGAVESARKAAGDDAEGAFRLIADGIGSESCRPGFRGCPFINAAAEYADPEHPVRRVVAEHRNWFRGVLTEMLTPLGVKDQAAVAEQLLMLRDGAMVAGYLGEPGRVGDELARSIVAVIDAAK